MTIIKKISDDFKEGKTAIFCGAGISYHSGFPLVAGFIEYMLYGIGLTKDEADQIVAARLPFETTAGVLAEESGSLKFLQIYDNGKPNANHYFMAALAKSGKLGLIVTTNFDVLIEKAFGEYGLQESHDFIVYSRERDFDKIDWESKKILIIKIHGTIRSKKEMAVNLRRISQAPLTVGRRGIIEKLFNTGKHTTVIVFGYSFSDVFDLSPQIASLTGRFKKVYVVQHVSGKLKPTVSHKVHSSLPFRKSDGCVFVKMDTDEAVRLMASDCLPDFHPATNRSKNDWQETIRKWLLMINKIDEAIFPAIAGKLFYLKSDFKKSLEHYEYALKVAGSQKTACDQLRNIGIVNKELGNYDRALIALNDAKTISVNQKNKKSEIAILNNMAYTLAANHNLEEAYECQKKSLRMAIKIRNKELRAINYNNLGIILGQMKENQEALKSFNKAIKLMDEIGYIQWKARTMNNIGIAKRLLGHVSAALEVHEKAFDLAVQLGFLDEQCLSLENIGRVYSKLGNNTDAITFVKKAIKIAEKTNNRASLHKSLNFLSKIYKSIGDDKKAKYNKRRALKFAPMKFDISQLNL